MNLQKCICMNTRCVNTYFCDCCKHEIICPDDQPISSHVFEIDLMPIYKFKAHFCVKCILNFFGAISGSSAFVFQTTGETFESINDQE